MIQVQVKSQVSELQTFQFKFINFNYKFSRPFFSKDQIQEATHLLNFNSLPLMHAFHLPQQFRCHSIAILQLYL